MSKEDCVMWSMVGTKIYKKCAQVYKLEERIKELEAIVIPISKTKKNWEYFADEVGVALCCSDCPGRCTGKVITVGDIRKLSNPERVKDDTSNIQKD